MACTACSASTVVFSIPEEYREHAPGESPAGTLCTRCLNVDPEGGSPLEEPDFTRVSDAYPSDPDAAIPLALAVDLCSSLATNRTAIEALFDAVERAGTDPLLVLDRLIDDPDVEPTIDLERRRHQLEQLLY
ncbi:hypothetical protein HTZ84_19815 [Haloterrigena sp. SYSU A558-1]|uniref:Small CPxCG-related zinc finger protein n=1 Tax=Haloterrigena gelatinilytica TaxID=2741724 RepID=A0A8J8GHS6_9EURY|nr:DUF6276 family protein [Haloterrigena gelatinilytica]NUB89656.1 hypothetical protein [Haloterrigena gelatinilytica]NUC74516.1 hypothetical protein [Haloterrigena gelatinilytica]